MSEDIRLVDDRLRRRHEWISARVADNPDKGFPEVAGSDGGLEAIYRFLNNPRVSMAALLEPHYEKAVEELSRRGEGYVLHDSSEFRFGGETARKGLGRLRVKGQGFNGHFALAVAADGSRLPLGLLGVTTHFRTGPTRKRSQLEVRADPEREFARWGALVEEVELKVNGRSQLIHVMDREADDYELLAKLKQANRRFIIRGRHDRVVEKLEADELPAPMRAVLAARPVLLVREVPLSKRGTQRTGAARRIHPPRNARWATLDVRAVTVRLRMPHYLGKLASARGFPEEIEFNVVQVSEPNPPPAEEGVDWLLLTSEPIDTEKAVEAIIDGYRTRWVIEEYFKALKTGCAYEKRQLESSHGLLNALGLLAPVAVQLLRLRNIARDDPDRPASAILTDTQVKILRVFSKRHPVGARPTVGDAMLAIAGLGGHIKNNGAPGWQVLGRGFEKLLALEEGWCAALASRKK